MKIHLKALTLGAFLGTVMHHTPSSSQTPTVSPQERANHLLLLRFNPCNENYHLPRNCLETAAFVSGMDDFSRFRDFGAIGLGFHVLMRNHGFYWIGEFSPLVRGLNTGRENIVSSVNTATIPQDLLPGDILAFVASHCDTGDEYSANNPPYIYVHAAVYLGAGYVFEKPNMRCGEQSPYRSILLTEVLGRAVGKPYVEDSSYGPVFVFRRR